MRKWIFRGGDLKRVQKQIANIGLKSKGHVSFPPIQLCELRGVAEYSHLHLLVGDWKMIVMEFMKAAVALVFQQKSLKLRRLT